ncbi:hypothetical protein C7999DRAFT_14490, partial [Corynascus novoguineensis]
SEASSLDELFDHCKDTNATVQIPAEGPGQTCGRRFMVEGGRKCILVEENTLTLSAAGRELLRDYRGDHKWTFLSSVVSWLACIASESMSLIRP